MQRLCGILALALSAFVMATWWSPTFLRVVQSNPVIDWWGRYSSKIILLQVSLGHILARRREP